LHPVRAAEPRGSAGGSVRGDYRRAFDGFDPALIARYDDAKVAALLRYFP
jgi:hypothetical protein